VVTTAQLVEACWSRSAIGRWAAKGLLHSEFRGVWRFGHKAGSAEAHYMAAVLACGEGAALSGPAALFHYGLLRGQPPAPEVTAPKDRQVPGIRTRKRKVETRIWRGISTTTVPQTLMDLASPLSLDALSHACHEAEIKFGRQALPTPTNAKLRAILHGDHALLLSEMERAFRAHLLEHAFPLPRTNRKRGAHYIDCRWADHRLTVELDSYRFHHSRHAWEQDHERARAARRRGDEFRRYTYKDVVEEPAEMLAELAKLLDFPAKLH
jgi:very-short-patch-repair endonuclease